MENLRSSWFRSQRGCAAPLAEWLFLFFLLSRVAATGQPLLEKIDLFEANKGQYAHYRIPGIVVTSKGTLLAYCEARKSTRGDWGTIDILLRRSTSGGKTWEPERKIVTPPAHVSKNPVALKQNLASAEEVTVNNPVAIVDHQTGAIHFLYCIEYARCFYMRSDDDGKTFTEPVEITATFEKFRPEYDWKVIATGPGHGIQLKNGRLIVPVWLSTGTGGHAHRPSIVSVVYSDDHGKTWKRSDTVPDTYQNQSETVTVQLQNGPVLLNMRNESPEHRRAISISADGVSQWSQPVLQPDLLEPICMGSIIRVTAQPEFRKSRIIFANPDNLEATRRRGPQDINKDRKNLTIKLSYDEGKSWPVSRVLEPGLSAYSDLTVGPDKMMYCFYERVGVNENMYNPRYLTLARFNLEWLTEGRDQLDQ